MTRYEVPQFSEVKTKIVGFLTIRQFIYVAVGALIIYILFKRVSLFWTFVFGLPVGALAASLAFLNINGQPFEQFLFNAMRFTVRPKFYIWKKDEPKQKKIIYKEENDNG